MKKIMQEITIYNFEELTEEAQNKVVCDYVNFIAETTDFEKIDKHTNLYKAYKECVQLQTPWFLDQYIYDYCKKDIMQKLKKLNYYSNGNIARF